MWETTRQDVTEKAITFALFGAGLIVAAVDEVRVDTIFAVRRHHLHHVDERDMPQLNSMASPNNISEGLPHNA